MLKPFVACLAGPALAVAAAVPAAAQQDEPLKVGFIYVGPIGDKGYTYQHDQGRLAVEDHFGDKIETVYQENVPEGADAVRALSQMALSGADLIFSTSFGFMDATVEAAEKFPDVDFEHATGYKTRDNLATYNARFYEGRAVLGNIAGNMTDSDIIGYIGAYPIPEVIRGINATFLEARKVNPDVEFRIIWARTWFDPAKEADAAKALIEQGADVILQHTDSTAPSAAAERAGGVITFGQASDMAGYKPRPRVASIIDNWGPYYIDRVQAELDGDWQSHSVWYGIQKGLVKIGEITGVPDDVRQQALEVKKRIGSGEYDPFTGPINKANGEQWLAEGETATDEELLSMDFYVEGIDADLPN